MPYLKRRRGRVRVQPMDEMEALFDFAGGLVAPWEAEHPDFLAFLVKRRERYFEIRDELIAYWLKASYSSSTFEVPWPIATFEGRAGSDPVRVARRHGIRIMGEPRKRLPAERVPVSPKTMRRLLDEHDNPPAQPRILRGDA